MNISQGDTVIFHFSLYLEDGSAADSSKVDGKPVKTVIGNGDFSLAFEANLITHCAGDEVEFGLGPEDAFGMANPDNIHYMERSRFSPDIVLEPGVIVAFANMAGQNTPGIIREVEGQSVKVDFNHPLAGKNVRFKIEILDVNP